MNPVYFPYTYITESSVLKLLSFFHSFTIYQIYEKKPDKHLEKFISNKNLLTTIPALCDANIIENIFNDFIQWKKIHTKTDISLLKTLTDSKFLFDNTSKYTIKSEILKGPDKKKEDVKNLILASQVFLNIAEDLDRKNDDVDKKLNDLSRLENNIFENLKGQEDKSHKIKTDSIHNDISDHKCYMAKERITAWSRLFLNYSQTGSNDLSQSQGPFITNNPFLFDHILKNIKDSGHLFIIKKIPACNNENDELIEFKNKLSDYIKKLIVSKNPAKENFNYSLAEGKKKQKTILLKLFVKPNTNPVCFFKQFIASDSKQKELKSSDKTHCNLIFGLIDNI